jgi:hypothetical protein
VAHYDQRTAMRCDRHDLQLTHCTQHSTDVACDSRDAVDATSATLLAVAWLAGGAWLAAVWLAAAWLRLKGWRRRLRLKGCAAQRLMLKGWLRRRARLRLRDGRHRTVRSKRVQRNNSQAVVAEVWRRRHS